MPKSKQKVVKTRKKLDLLRVLCYNIGMDKEQRIAELEAENVWLKNENTKLKILNDWYLEQYRLAQHRRFGSSSEKAVLPGQLGLFNEAEVLADEPEEQQIPAHTRKKRKGKRKEFYEGLPTEQIIHELPEGERICPDCGGPLHACGHEVLRREVEVIPAQVRAVEHVQTVYGCRNCEKDAEDDAPPMMKAPVPAPVIAGSGIASPSLVSIIMCNKYVLALPLYRQEQELQRIGVHISRQTMANWIIFTTSKWLRPIYDLLKEALLCYAILHADETILQVVKEDGREASQKSYMWEYHTGRDAGKQVALFEYQPTREGEHPQKFLAGFQGYLHVDGYAGYKSLEEQGVTIVECWAHARRKFHEALKALRKEDQVHSPANIGLEYCDKLFALERQFDEEKLTCEARQKRRILESKPVAEAFFSWAESVLPDTLPKSKLRQAVGYAINQRQWLMNFLLDARLELSNNRAERTIRSFTVGRKNWLFSYCAKGAEASAIAYSIIETAQANGLVPFMYLTYLFQTLPNIPLERFSECLPWSPAVQEVCKIPQPEL
jgi:transposase